MRKRWRRRPLGSSIHQLHYHFRKRSWGCCFVCIWFRPWAVVGSRQLLSTDTYPAVIHETYRHGRCAMAPTSLISIMMIASKNDSFLFITIFLSNKENVNCVLTARKSSFRFDRMPWNHYELHRNNWIEFRWTLSPVARSVCVISLFNVDISFVLFDKAVEPFLCNWSEFGNTP